METVKASNQTGVNLPPKSIWRDRVKEFPERPSLIGDHNTEVLIIGAGMAGLLLAWQLKEAGVPTMVVEAKTIAGGVTQNTTAKITAQHGFIYQDLIKRFGVEQARLYYDVNTKAIEGYHQLAKAFPCDLEERTAYSYTVDDKRRLEWEADAYHKLGLKSQIEEVSELPIQTAGALAMAGQAQFHPLKLLTMMAAELEIYEHTLVQKVVGQQVLTDQGRITAKHIILATHYPMVNIPGLYFLKLFQHRSYVMALRNAPSLQGMYIDENPTGHSFRTYDDLLLVGGGAHRTGKLGGGYDALTQFAATTYPQAQLTYRWATQDCMSLDGVPYIGRHHLGEQKLYVATGFNKWGMTSSMVAARLLGDLIINGKSEAEALFSPQRSIWTRQLAANVSAATAGLLSFGGPRCSHMGCKLHRNQEEGIWECSCHGSCFDEKGHVLHNPAKNNL